jgi:outer membrane receptor for ferrienterochelin and colicins
MRFARRRPALPLDLARARVAASPFLSPCAVVTFVLVWVAMADVAESEPAASPDVTAAHGAEIFPEPDAGEGEPPVVSRVDEAASGDQDALGEVIVVTGTRSETPLDSSPVATEVVRRDQIEASGAETLAEALSFKPGLWIDRGVGGTGVTMQGLGSEYVLVLVDGQRQIGRVDGTVDLDRMGVGEVEQVEIVRGPSSALYGSDALGGVINVIRRDPSEPEAEVMARTDSEESRDLRGRVAGRRGDLLGSLAGEWREGPSFDRSPGDPSTTISAYEDWRVAGSAGLRRGEWLEVDAHSEYLRRDLRGATAQPAGGIFDRRNLIEGASGRLSAVLSGDRTVARFSAGVGLHRDQFVNDQRNSGAMDQDEETNERLVEATAQVERALFERHRVTAGAEVMYEVLESDRLVDGDGDRSRISAYAQDEWRIGERYQLLVMPAARVDHDSQFGTHATPRLAARYDVTDHVITRGSLGFGFRAPGFKELYLRFENPGVGYVVDGNRDLDPETSWSAQGGAEWRARRWLYLGASGFYNDIDNLITAVTKDEGGVGAPIVFSYDNIGRARTMGGELTVALRRGRLGIEAGYAYTAARDMTKERRLGGVPSQRAMVGVRWRDPGEGFEASTEAAVTGGRPFYMNTTDDQDAFLTDVRTDVRARVAKTFAKRLTCFLGVDNILDAGDETYDPIAPRTIYVGVIARQ